MVNMFSERVQSRDGQRLATIQGVVSAAETLFHRQGFKATTVRQIAAAAGVSIGTVMAAGDKDSLLVAVMDRHISQLHRDRQLPDAGFLAMKVGTDAEGMIAALVAPFLQLFADDLPLAREYGAILLRGSSGSAVFGELAASLKAEFEQVFRLFGLRTAHARNAATAVHLAYLGILLAWAGGVCEQHQALAQLKIVVGTVLHPGGA